MRKVMVWGFVVVAVGVLFTGAQAQRIAPEPTAPASKPSQVEVTNFPAVQSVNGTVNVGNLPLDPDGNVRVAGIAQAPTSRWIHMATAMPVTYQFGGLTEPIDVSGWRRAHFLIRPNDTIQVYPYVEYGSDDAAFGTMTSGPWVQNGGIVSTDVAAPQARVRFQTQYDVTVDVWVYLSN